MRASLPISLAATLLSGTVALAGEITLDPSKPIYIGDVFWPPTMSFIAWLPDEDEHLWCYKAMDASNHRLFSLGGVDALQIHDYFNSPNARITREGHDFATCYITPQSGRMGICTAVEDWDCEGGTLKQKFTGPGTRGWNCYINPGAWDTLLIERRVREAEFQSNLGRGNGITTGVMMSPGAEVTLGPMGGEGIKAQFTAGVTGRLS